MVEKLNERKQREIDAMKSKGVRKETNMVSDKQLFAKMGKSVKWKKK